MRAEDVGSPILTSEKLAEEIDRRQTATDASKWKAVIQVDSDNAEEIDVIAGMCDQLQLMRVRPLCDKQLPREDEILKELPGIIVGRQQTGLRKVAIWTKGDDPPKVNQVASTTNLVVESKPDIVMKFSAEERYCPGRVG